MAQVCLCSLDETIISLLKTTDSEEYREWLNARMNNSRQIEKPCFIYIKKNKKNKKPLSKFHALIKSIEKEHYHDISYYANKLLMDGVKADEIVHALLPRVRVYATIYDQAHFIQRFKNDPILIALAYSDVTTLEETNKYIKSQLTAEELPYFIGDTLEALPPRPALSNGGSALCCACPPLTTIGAGV